MKIALYTCRAFLALLVLVAPVLRAAPAIPNPSFETDQFTSTVSPYIVDNKPITGWTVASADTGYVGLNPNGSGIHDFANNGMTPDGANVVFIQCRGGHAPTKLSTTITGLTAGVIYQVKFRANARYGGTPSPSYQLNGGPVVPFSVTNVDDVNVFTDPYATISGIFTATGTTAALAISNNTPSADTSVLLDNFTVAVAPATFALSSSAYTAVAGYPLTVTITRGQNFSGAATVRLFTTPGTAGAADYAPRPDTSVSDVSFEDGEPSKDVVINIDKSTKAMAADKTFTFTLDSPAPAGLATIITPSTAAVTIKSPATLQVTNTNDDGPGSLRQALATAASTPAYDVITFAPALNGKTITLGNEIIINDAVGVTIDASALPAGLTIDGGPGGNRIFTVGNTAVSSLTLLHLTLINGHGGSSISMLSGAGGAICSFPHSALLLTQCTLFGNSAQNAGALFYSGDVTMVQCTFSGNSASGEGGVSENDLGYATLTMRQCTLSGNTAPQGGALWTDAGGIVLTQCTLSNNVATGTNVAHSGAGGIQSGGTLAINNCIIAGNSAANGRKDIVCSSLSLQGTSIVQDLSHGTLSGSGTILNADPMLALLANNGGPTQTMALLPGSPAFNGAAGSTLTTDQRGLPVVGLPDIGAFELQAGGVFSFSQPSYSVDKTAGHVNVTINRGVAFVGPASVKISTSPGTAGKANFNSATEVISFLDGETSKSVGIDILNDNHADADLTFTVTLSNPSAGASMASPASATVVITDPSLLQDTTKPGVPVFTSPAANAMVGVPAGGKLTLIGNATDNKGIGEVDILDSTGKFLVAAALSAPNAATTGWTAAVIPATGNNLFQVIALDSNGNTSPTVGRSFTILRPLVVSVSGYGSVTAGYAPSSYQLVGKPQTLTATPGAGYLFTGWSILSSNTAASIGVSTSALALPTITFLHQEGLALRATFAPSPYTAANTGVFNGGIDPSSSVPAGGTAASLSTMGYVSAMVQTTGTFTAALKLDGTSYPVSGVFDVVGTARFGTSRATTFTIVRSNLPALFVTLGIKAGTGVVSGVVSAFDGASVTASSTITAERCPFGSANLVPASLLGTANADATYTLIMPAISGQTLGNANYPQGSGYASMKLTKAGAVTVSGVLADGTSFTESTTLSAAQHWRLFVSLYGNKGLVAGNAVFGPSNYDFLALSSTWLRPVMDSQYYPGGWADGINFNVAGAKYTVTAGQSVLPGLDVAGDAELDFSGAGLASTVKDSFTTTGADVIHNTANDVTYKLTINRMTGMFTGFFTAPDGSKPVFNGVVLTKGLSTQSAGFFLTPAPKVNDYAGQSGNVILSATP